MVNNKKLRYVFAAFLIAWNSMAFAATASLCTAAGYTLGFFNGVWNSSSDAMDGLVALSELVPTTYNGKSVSPELFYNHTGCGTAGNSCLQDLAEVFIQRAQEIDASGTLGSRLELFWESIGSGDQTFTGQIATFFSSAAGTLSALYTKVIAQAVAGWSYLLSHPPTNADYAVHNARLDALATQGQMLLLVAHSQGNLFVNQAYDHISPMIGANAVNVVHVAPASTTLRGPYELADIDLVINGLRFQGISSVPAVNLTLPLSTADASGHTLVGTYLDPSRPGRAAVTSLVSNALAALTPSNSITASAVGSFTVTLTWSGTGDEDMHVFEPSGSHVYYQSKAGVAGYLDTDNTVGFGPEHYYASCNPSVLQVGTYQVGLNDYNGADGETATVQFATANGGVLLTKQLNTGATRGSSGDNSPSPAMAITVSKDANGNFMFAAQ